MSFPSGGPGGKRGAGGAGLHANKRPCSGVNAAVPNVTSMPYPGNPLLHAQRAPDQPECNYLGVRWNRKKNKWRVRIKANGKVQCVCDCSEWGARPAGWQTPMRWLMRERFGSFY